MKRWIVPLGIGAVALLLAIRAAAPIAVELALEGPLGQGAFQLALDDVDLEVMRGAAVFEGLSLHRDADESASLLCERVRVRIGWLDLLERRLQLRAIEIDSPQLEIRRGPDGRIELLELFDAGDETGTRAEAPEDATPEPGWSFAVDEGALETGRLRLRDLGLGEPGRWSAALDELVVRQLSLSTATHDEPGALHLEAELDGAPLSLSARFGSADDAPAVEAELELGDFAPRRTQVRLEAAGWSQVRGRVDASLQYRSQRAGPPSLSGSLALRELAIRKPDAGEPALTWQSLSFGSVRADMGERRLSIGELRLAGGELRLDAAGRPELLAPAGSGSAARGAPDAEPLADAEKAPPDASAERPTWSLEVAQARVDDSRIRLALDPPRGGERDLAIELQVRARDARWRAGSAAPFPVQAELRARGASLSFDGRLGAGPWAAGGELRWQGLDLARFARDFAPEWVSRALQSARSEGRMRVDVRDGTRLAGTLTLEEVRFEEVAKPDTLPCGMAWAALELPVEELSLPWPGGRDPKGSTVRLRFGRVRLLEPELSARREAEGLGCPIAPEAETPEREIRWKLEVEAERLDVEKGRIHFLDQTVSPFMEIELADVAGFARALRAAPQLEIDELALRGAGIGAQRIELEGALAPGAWKLDARAGRLGLLRLNPYTHRYTPFFVRSGDASFSMKARRSPERIEADIDLVLHDLLLDSEEPDAFRKRFGLPLPVAMALLRDARGDIALDLPISQRADEVTELDVGALIYGALRRALFNSMTVPLKLLGAVVTRDEEIETFTPQPILFLPGRSALSAEGADQVARLAEVLVGHPFLATRLEPFLGDTDPEALAARPAAPERPAAAGTGKEAESAPQTLEALAAARVAAVVGRLRDRHGVSLSRMQVVIAPEPQIAGAARVELALVPLAAPPDAPVQEPPDARAGGAPAATGPPPSEPPR